MANQDDNYNDGPAYGGNNPTENPLDGIEKAVTDVMVSRLVEFTCRKIATCRDRRHFVEIYKLLSSLPVKAILQLPKPLLDEFWKFVNAVCQADARDNAAHGLRALINGSLALLNAEDQFQQDFHGLDMVDLIADYEEGMRELGQAMSLHGESYSEWAAPAFRIRKKLPMCKGRLEAGQEQSNPAE